VVICLKRGADLHMAQLMPLPLNVSCFSKIQIGFTFLVPAHLGSPGQRVRARACVCVLNKRRVIPTVLVDSLSPSYPRASCVPPGLYNRPDITRARRKHVMQRNSCSRADRSASVYWEHRAGGCRAQVAASATAGGAVHDDSHAQVHPARHEHGRSRRSGRSGHGRTTFQKPTTTRNGRLDRPPT